MKNYIIILLVGLLIFPGCESDLEVMPIDPSKQFAATVYDNPESYKQILAKIYAGLATTGQKGPDGEPDISGIDEGFSSYVRTYWNHQELPTDEVVTKWKDVTLLDFNSMKWGAGDVWVQALYSRIFYQITLANEYLRETNDSKLNERGVTDALRSEIKRYRAETRFLRALSYWHALDLFGSVPFVTEENAIGAFLPEQISRKDLFDYIENELLEIEDEMAAPMQNEYPRADKAAVWMLLAKLYLNAEVYTGSQKYTEAITQLKKVIDAGYELSDVYELNFQADNHLSPEIIFAVAFDGNNTKTWGGTTIITHGAVGGSMDPAAFGIDGGWEGFRTTSALVNKFNDISGETDARAMFYTNGQSLEINDIEDFTHGYAITKYKNIDSNGNPGSNLTHVDIDFPMFRLADAYLMYAEAVLRGGEGGSLSGAVSYINKIRERAYGNSEGNILQTELTLDFILDERARELYWEAHRRTDLIRYNLFTTNEYLWPWKGGAKEGTSVDDIYNLYPIPSSDLAANPNLKQNKGY